MKFALRAPILKYTLFGMLFLNSPAQASEPRSERMEKTAAEVIAADSAAIPKGWDNDCRASYKAGYEAGYRAGYLHGRRTATQPHSSGRASATRYADGSIVPTRDTTASGRRFMHRIGAEFRPEYIFPTNPFVQGNNTAGQPIDLSLSGHLRYSFQFRPGSIPDQIYGGAYQGIGAAYYDFGNPDELGNPVAAYLFQRAGTAVLDTEAQLQHLLLPGRQGTQHVHQLLLQQGEAGGLAGLGRGLVGDEVAQMAVLLLADGGLQRDRLLGDLQNLPHLVHGHAHLGGDLLRRGVVTEGLEQLAGDADDALTLLTPPLTVGDRHLKLDLKALPRDPDRAYLQISAAWMDDRPGADQADVPAADTYTVSVRTNVK